MVSVSRGSSAGSGRRAGFFEAMTATAGCAGDGSAGGLVSFQFFQLQFELLDIGVQLFRFRAEVHALELQNQQLQVLNLGLLREDERL